MPAGESRLAARGPGKEQGADGESSGGAERREERGDTTCHTNLPRPFLLEFILAERCTRH